MNERRKKISLEISKPAADNGQTSVRIPILESLVFTLNKKEFLRLSLNVRFAIHAIFRVLATYCCHSPRLADIHADEHCRSQGEQKRRPYCALYL